MKLTIVLASLLFFIPTVLASSLHVQEKTEEIPQAKVLTVEEEVKLYFKNDPTMWRIAYCESKYRQFNKDGSLLRGVQNPKDVGVFQINEYWHLAQSKRLGLDIHTLKGNLAYAAYLRAQNGYRDWGWSKSCWSV